MVDTLSIARNLRSAGVERDLAEAHAEAIANAIEQQHGDIATKDFVSAQVNTLRGELKTVESNLLGEMKTCDLRMLRWVIGAIFTSMGLTIAAVSFIL